jgi:hypothetical protein
MELSIVLWLLFGLLFGGMMLALTMGYLDAEEKRARESREREAEVAASAEVVAEMPRFFAKLQPKPSTTPRTALDERLLADLESYVRAEQAVVNLFVDDPSIDSLYRRAGSAVPVN